MKRGALVLGLGAVLNAFLFHSLAMLLILSTSGLPVMLWLLVGWAAAVFTAFKLAPLVAGDGELPPSLLALLLFAGGFALLVQLLQSAGVNFGFGKLGLFLVKASKWSAIISAVLVIRLLKPRVALFVGLTAFAVQLQSALILAPLMVRVPEWIPALITIVVAILVARSFCVGAESPADRVTQPGILWWFAASGVLALIMAQDFIWVRSWMQILVWLSFLASFVLLVRGLEPDDPDHTPSALGVGYGPLILVFVALLVIVASVFHGSELVSRRMSFSAGAGMRAWLPFLVCAVVAVLVMVTLQLGKRIPQVGPGRKALGWGLVLYIVAILAGGSVLGAAAGSDAKLVQLAVFVLGFTILVVPIMALAQLLFAIGLLRVLFALEPPPRG